MATHSHSWRERLRDIHDSNFDFDWDTHLRDLNDRLGLGEFEQFGLPPGLPPAWFVGDVDATAPGSWVLVVSLNQARREADDAWHTAQRFTRETYWEHWRSLNRDWWEPRFYRPLVRLGAAALGVAVPRRDESEFATTSMIFVELCPYPSRRWGLSPDTVAALSASDRGFQTATEVRSLLIEGATPAIIMVNGVAALDSFEQIERGRVHTTVRRYASASRPERELWHREGACEVASGRRVPILGFPFLRKPQTHNSYAEIDQLGATARELVLAPHRTPLR